MLTGIDQVKPYGKGILVISGRSYVEDEHLATHILERHADELTAWPMIFIVDDAEEVVKNQTSFLWTTFTRFNPATDMFARSSVNRHHLNYELPLIIDARMKPDYPDELFPREDIVARVDRRWKEYFPSI
jgi:3-polyprenyl-4-hydroxybenzoate decarboxylase